jgi:glutamate 5-kinase
MVAVAIAGATGLVGATAWVVSTVNDGTKSTISALGGQVAGMDKIVGDLEHRTTILESQQLSSSADRVRISSETAEALNHLSTEVEQLRLTENDLMMALQRMKDLESHGRR